MAGQLQRLFMMTVAVSLSPCAATVKDVPERDIVAFFNGGCEEHICESECVPWNGGYVCKCPEGRSLLPNGFSCSDLPLEGYKTVSTDAVTKATDEKPQKDEIYIPAGDLPIDQSQPTDDNQSKLLRSTSKAVVDSDSDTSNSDSKNDLSDHKESKLDKKSDEVNNKFENRTKDYLQYFSYDLRSGMLDPAELVRSEQESHLRVEPASIEVGASDVSAVGVEVEVPPPECLNFVCRNGGQCSVRDGEPKCDCPLGKRGKRCGKDVEIRFPKLSGSGYLAFPVLRNAYKEFTITIEFKPQTLDGLLLFSSEREDARGDFFSIALVDGKVHFRFDCGTGMAMFQSESNVTLREWNTVWVQRVDSHGWLKLNTEMPIESEAKGNYTRITLREDLYLGGYRHLDKVGARVGTNNSFVGCVQELWVNSYKYDMRQGSGKVGDAKHGLNVDECSHNICGEVNCENGGRCVARSADRHVCLCPLGTGSALCEKEVTVHVPSFSGHSYLQYQGLGRTTLTYTEIEVVFKPEHADGLILYNGYTEDRKGDFIALLMRAGHVEFSFDLGTGPAVLRSLEPVSLGSWHVVRVYRTGMDGVLHVDKQEPVEGLSKGAYTQLTLLLPLFVGGHADYDTISKHINVTHSFKGCIQKVVINEKPLKLISEAVEGINVENCAHPCVGSPCVNGGECVPDHGDYECRCPLGYTNTNCEDIVGETISVPRFEGSGYVRFLNPDIIKRVVGKKIDIQMNMRATAEDGLLFWSGQEPFTPSSDYLALGFNDGFLQFRYNLGSGEVIVQHNSSQLFDGRIHSLRAQRDGRDAYLSIDGTEIYEGSSPGKYKYLNTNMQLYLGGMPDVAHNTRRKFTAGLSGCIYKLVLATDYEVNLIGQAESGQNVQQCP